MTSKPSSRLALRALGALMSATLLTGGALPALAQGSSPAPSPAPAASGEQSVKDGLQTSRRDFNAGNFEGYLHDFEPHITYNGLPVDRTRLVEINKELKESFANLKMRYEQLRVRALSPSEISANTVTEFTGSTNNYDNSGLAATYRETGQVTALYHQDGGKWLTNTLDVSWNDSFIDIGQVFGAMGFSTLPTLTGTSQPYRLRLWVGDDERPGFGVSYAYVMAPLKSVIEKSGAEQVFKELQFKNVPSSGLDLDMVAPKEPGTYAHVLVINKYWRAGNNESIVGQKIYTRLVRVE